MSADRDDGAESFLRRWSRVKSETREVAEAPPVAVPPVTAKPQEDERAPELPPIDKLTLDSDFSGFFHPKVDEDLRRQALHKLFSDPHFNVMDGLDVYIDDYSKSEPIPAAMLASLKQAQRILEWAADKKEETPAAGAEGRADIAEPAGNAAAPEALEALDTKAVPQQLSNDREAQPFAADATAPSART